MWLLADIIISLCNPKTNYVDLEENRGNLRVMKCFLDSPNGKSRSSFSVAHPDPKSHLAGTSKTHAGLVSDPVATQPSSTRPYMSTQSASTRLMTTELSDDQRMRNCSHTSRLNQSQR